MKKMSKLVMAAILAVAMQGTAMAVVDLDTGLGAQKYANELITENTTVINTTNFTPSYVQGTVASALDVTGKLNFGVSEQQTRYIRFDLTGVQFSTPLAATDLVLTNATVALASQGASFVIFQITANEDFSPTKVFGLTIPNLRVTNKTNPATIRYSLYEQAGYAVNQTPAGLLNTPTTPTIATFGPGLDISVNSQTTTTADVTTSYATFKDGVTNTIAQLGTMDYQTIPGVLNTTSGTVALSDLITSASRLIVTTDNTFASATNVFLAGPGGCTDTPAVTVTSLGTGTTASLNVGTTAYQNRAICYTANGNAPIAVQNFDLAGDITPATGTTTQDVAAMDFGNFIQDGTILRAPFIQGQAGQSSYVQLANMGQVNAGYKVTCYGPTGTATQGLEGSVTAGQTKKVYMNNTGCPSGTNALEFILSVTEGSVVGSFIRQNTTSGDTAADSLTGNKISADERP